MVSFARSAGYRSVFLDTVKELEPAAALYRSAGFVVIGAGAHPIWGRELTQQRYELRFDS